MREFIYGAFVGILIGIVISLVGMMVKVTIYGPDAAPRFCQSRMWSDTIEIICDN